MDDFAVAAVTTNARDLGVTTDAIVAEGQLEATINASRAIGPDKGLSTRATGTGTVTTLEGTNFDAAFLFCMCLNSTR